MSTIQMVMGMIVCGASSLILLFFLLLLVWPSKPAEPDEATRRFVSNRARDLQMSSEQYMAKYYPDER